MCQSFRGTGKCHYFRSRHGRIENVRKTKITFFVFRDLIIHGCIIQSFLKYHIVHQCREIHRRHRHPCCGPDPWPFPSPARPRMKYGPAHCGLEGTGIGPPRYPRYAVFVNRLQPVNVTGDVLSVIVAPC